MIISLENRPKSPTWSKYDSTDLDPGATSRVRMTFRLAGSFLSGLLGTNIVRADRPQVTSRGGATFRDEYTGRLLILQGAGILTTPDPSVEFDDVITFGRRRTTNPFSQTDGLGERVNFDPGAPLGRARQCSGCGKYYDETSLRFCREDGLPLLETCPPEDEIETGGLARTFVSAV
jgi:hypothetical protein